MRRSLTSRLSIGSLDLPLSNMTPGDSCSGYAMSDQKSSSFVSRYRSLCLARSKWYRSSIWFRSSRCSPTYRTSKPDTRSPSTIDRSSVSVEATFVLLGHLLLVLARNESETDSCSTEVLVQFCEAGLTTELTKSRPTDQSASFLSGRWTKKGATLCSQVSRDRINQFLCTRRRQLAVSTRHALLENGHNPP